MLSTLAAPAPTTQQSPAVFTYQELAALYEEEPLSEALRRKLERLTTTPVFHNGATARGVRPLNPEFAKLAESRIGDFGVP